jgi:hypothetical protein
MAVVVNSSETKAPNISDITIVDSDFKCTWCQHLQEEIETALLELKIGKSYIIPTIITTLHYNCFYIVKLYSISLYLFNNHRSFISLIYKIYTAVLMHFS